MVPTNLPLLKIAAQAALPWSGLSTNRRTAAVSFATGAAAASAAMAAMVDSGCSTMHVPRGGSPTTTPPSPRRASQLCPEASRAAIRRRRRCRLLRPPRSLLPCFRRKARACAFLCDVHQPSPRLLPRQSPAVLPHPHFHPRQRHQLAPVCRRRVCCANLELAATGSVSSVGRPAAFARTLPVLVPSPPSSPSSARIMPATLAPSFPPGRKPFRASPPSSPSLRRAGVVPPSGASPRITWLEGPRYLRKLAHQQQE
eukprot:4815804-Pleurochrysis_carterae.AAC.1